MTSPASKLPDTVGALMRQRLRELGRSTTDLATAVGMPEYYIDDLIAGSRRPPLPGRTDIYVKMTAFLRLSRNDLTTRATAERAGSRDTATGGPSTKVRDLLLALCDPRTARTLEQRRAKNGGAELSGFFQRLLDVVHSSVRRSLDDAIGLRLTAASDGSTYVDLRCRVLEFLDLTADRLTAEDLAYFVRPRVTSWNVDLKSGVLRVVLRSPEPRVRKSAVTRTVADPV